jgi:hypothetical protein
MQGKHPLKNLTINGFILVLKTCFGWMEIKRQKMSNVNDRADMVAMAQVSPAIIDSIL